MQEQERKKWGREINSDSNHNLIDYYKDKLEEKEKRVRKASKINFDNFYIFSSQIQELEKKTKKFAIFEKKLLVKEKAFEIERSDYHEKLQFLNDRIHE